MMQLKGASIQAKQVSLAETTNEPHSNHQQNTTSKQYQQQAQSPKIVQQSNHTFKAQLEKYDLMLFNINLQVSYLAERNGAQFCRFIIFLIPFSYTIAEMLAHYEGDYTKTYNYRLFLFVLDRIMKLGRQTSQMPKQQVYKFLKFIIKKQNSPIAISNQLKLFLAKYDQRLSSLIPVYKLYFQLVCNKRQIFKSYQEIKLSDIKAKIEEVKIETLKYHNENI